MRYDERPVDDTPLHTEELPATPVRDRNIPATAWVEAPDDLLALGDDLPGAPVAEYKRRIGPGCCGAPGRRRAATPGTGRAAAGEPTPAFTLRLHPDGTAEGAARAATVTPALPGVEGGPPRLRCRLRIAERSADRQNDDRDCTCANDRRDTLIGISTMRVGIIPGPTA